MARPRDYSDAQMDAVIDGVRAGLTQKRSCELAGVSYNAFRSRLKREPELRERIDQAMAHPVMACVQTIMSAIREGDAKIALQFLERIETKYAPPSVQLQREIAEGAEQSDDLQSKLTKSLMDLQARHQLREEEEE
jgi:hypothetical protein